MFLATTIAWMWSKSMPQDEGAKNNVWECGERQRELIPQGSKRVAGGRSVAQTAGEQKM
jgi:hypothetical protein